MPRPHLKSTTDAQNQVAALHLIHYALMCQNTEEEIRLYSRAARRQCVSRAFLYSYGSCRFLAGVWSRDCSCTCRRVVGACGTGGGACRRCLRVCPPVLVCVSWFSSRQRTGRSNDCLCHVWLLAWQKQQQVLLTDKQHVSDSDKYCSWVRVRVVVC